eukprot:NODE_5123_length_1064_cov_28.940489_g4567_i0.p1 GENE.NODE_5123_length_1064_cov_28.940489_g4567_i0~~NODE_5123_length_1064_cov_28.940489_g4567_i0.p1  ORF type:complete len:305 (-),score=87.24 NODE_5123_length_1064_cov_28.940489_g4567_i0:69-983(-)
MDREKLLEVLPLLGSSVSDPQLLKKLADTTEGDPEKMINLLEEFKSTFLKEKGYDSELVISQINTASKTYKDDQEVKAALRNLVDAEAKVLQDASLQYTQSKLENVKLNEESNPDFSASAPPPTQAVPAGHPMAPMMSKVQEVVKTLPPEMQQQLQQIQTQLMLKGPGSLSAEQQGLMLKIQQEVMKKVQASGGLPPQSGHGHSHGGADGGHGHSHGHGHCCHGHSHDFGNTVSVMKEIAASLPPETMAQMQQLQAQIMTRGPQSLTEQQRAQFTQIQQKVMSMMQSKTAAVNNSNPPAVPPPD